MVENEDTTIKLKKETVENLNVFFASQYTQLGNLTRDEQQNYLIKCAKELSEIKRALRGNN